jgi:YD repeat-containing protein
MAYNKGGNLSTHTDFNGHTTVLAYDSMGRLLSKAPDAYFNMPPIVFTWFANGQRATMTDTTGTIMYTYDQRDRVLVKASPEGTLTYTYDAVGNRLSINSEGNKWRQRRLHLGRGRAPLQHHRQLFRWRNCHVQLRQGRESSRVTYPNGVDTTYAYDNLNRLLNLTATNANTSTTVASYAYSLGPTGIRTSVTKASGRTVNLELRQPLPAHKRDHRLGAVVYQYDYQDRLVSMNNYQNNPGYYFSADYYLNRKDYQRLCMGHVTSAAMGVDCAKLMSGP